MAASPKVSPKNETLDVDDYVMRLRTGGKKTRLVPRRADRRQLEDRRSGLDRRTRSVPVAEERRKNNQDRRSWTERRTSGDRRGLHVEYVGNSAFAAPASTGNKKNQPGFLRKFLKKTGFIEN
ncbi:TPA: hypothetical protein DDW35_05350 [Candidatus Sumerlaeota bacterium]|jgi:hypothetical protein|nr:hypothetical protein [Candidatus Sumerlaeota bacterium]